MDEPTGDEFKVEEDGRRAPSCVFVVPLGDSSAFFSFTDWRLLRLRLWRKEGIAAMLLWRWDTGRNYKLIGVTSGSQRADAEKLQVMLSKAGWWTRNAALGDACRRSGSRSRAIAMKILVQTSECHGALLDVKSECRG